MSINLSIHLSIYLSIYFSIYLFHYVHTVNSSAIVCESPATPTRERAKTDLSLAAGNVNPNP